MSLMKDTIIDIPVDDTDYDFLVLEKRIEEAEQARRADLEELERDNQLER